MTIDKIKHYMGEFLFNHWSSVTDETIIKKAIELLEHELKSGLLVGIKYEAELKFLKYRAGV